MIEMSLSVTRPDLLSAYAEGLAQAPDFTYAIVSNAIVEAGDELLVELKTEPGPVAAPIEWTSLKQKRYMAIQRRLGLIAVPYVRTHDLVNRWKQRVTRSADGMTSIEVLNDSPIRKFVIGQYQQKFHANTGWYQESNVLGRTISKITDVVETNLIKVLYLIEDYAEEHSR